MERVKMTVAGFFIGGFLGWFMGVAWYELIEVPKDAFMDLATGDTLQFLAIPGAILGSIVGALKKRL